MSKRTKRISFWITPEEKIAIEAAALKANMPFTDYIRHAALNYEMRPDELKFIKCLVKEIGETTERIHQKLSKSSARHAKWKQEMKELKASRYEQTFEI
jgi:hypothetical protein